MLSTNKKVLIRGPTTVLSGYSSHSREVFRWALQQKKWDIHTQVLPWGDCSWCLNPDYYNGLIGEIMKRSVDPDKNKEKYDITFQIQLPNEWNPALGTYNVGITALVETDICNPTWLDCINKMNLCIVPSQHTLQTILKTAEFSRKQITTKVVVIPEMLSDEIILGNVTKSLDLDLKTNFNYLVSGQLTGFNPENDRKNLFYTIKWLAESFRNDKDVGVVIKTNSGRNSHIDRQQTFLKLKQLIQEVRKSEFPKFYFLHGFLSDEEMFSLYKHPKIKCLVSLTAGEGFSRHLLEGAASGLPIIATNWSGHLDFMNLGKWIKVNYDLKEIHPSRVDGQIFIQGSKWAKVQEEDAKRKIEKFRFSPAIPTEWANELKPKLLENYSFANVAKKYDQVFQENYNK